MRAPACVLLLAAVAALDAAGVPAGAVRGLHEVLTQEQILARRMVESVVHPVAGEIRLLGVPVKLSETPGNIRTPPPTLGEHTDCVLTRDLGLSTARVAELREEGVI